MTGRLVAFNCFERELKNVNHFSMRSPFKKFFFCKENVGECIKDQIKAYFQEQTTRGIFPSIECKEKGDSFCY